MKSFLTILSVFFLTGSIVQAQSVAGGISDVYAERYQTAKGNFEKILAANPNDIQATYWLGQAYLGMDDVAGARSVYEKGLTTSANAPLLLVGLGQVELIENKLNEARQHFETAITMTGSKKGNDPEILNAVGRAIANVYTDKERKGDINFAVQKLEEASQAKIKDNALLADIYVNLGTAYRKAKPGENGGLAFSSYQKAIEANPAFAPGYYQTARLFNTQHNWELYEKYLTDAITHDPRFAPAYFDLSYFKMGKLDLVAAAEFAEKFAQNADPDPQNEYLKGSLLYTQKKYDEAIAIGQSILSRVGDKTKAKVYKLLAYSYMDKGDTVTARQYVDTYFAKEKAEEIVPKDYLLKANIYSAIPGQEAVVAGAYKEAVKADTVLSSKIDLIKEAIGIVNKKKQYVLESELQQLLLATKPDLTINDLFGATVADYRARNNVRSRDIATQMAEKYPDQQYGWEWKFYNAQILDTVKKDSIAVPDALNLLTFTKGDTVKYATQISKASYFLALYYNDAGERDSAIQYLEMMKSASADPATKQKIQQNIETLRAAPVRPPSKPSAASNNSPRTPAATNSKNGG